MKAHIGTDRDSGAARSVHCTAANVADITATEHLLQGEKKHVFADAGYIAVSRSAQTSRSGHLPGTLPQAQPGQGDGQRDPQRPLPRILTTQGADPLAG
jgi:IS5 family transposase